MSRKNSIKKCMNKERRNCIKSLIVKKYPRKNPRVFWSYLAFILR